VELCLYLDNSDRDYKLCSSVVFDETYFALTFLYKGKVVPVPFF